MRNIKNWGRCHSRKRLCWRILYCWHYYGFSANRLNWAVWPYRAWSGLLPEPSHVDDGTVSIAMALLLFLIPSRTRPGKMVMNWRTAVNLPWGIVILFGGGFALAYAFKTSGLSLWIGHQLTGLSSIPPILIIAAICLNDDFPDRIDFQYRDHADIVTDYCRGCNRYWNQSAFTDDSGDLVGFLRLYAAGSHAGPMRLCLAAAYSKFVKCPKPD